jgi:hypothetical protein
LGGACTNVVNVAVSGHHSGVGGYRAEPGICVGELASLSWPHFCREPVIKRLFFNRLPIVNQDISSFVLWRKT